MYQVDYPSGGLEVGKEYTWTFSAICDRTYFSKSIDIEGQIQPTQVNPGLQDLLRNSQGLEKAAWYASSGYLQKEQGKEIEKDAIAAYAKAVSHLKSLRRDLALLNRDVQFSFRQEVEPVYREYVSLLWRSHQQESNGHKQQEMDNVTRSRLLVMHLLSKFPDYRS